MKNPVFVVKLVVKKVANPGGLVRYFLIMRVCTQ